MTVSVNGTTGITFNDASTQNTAATGFGFKNRIINGAMMIDQRNAGATVTPSNETVTYITDRFAFIRSSSTSPTLGQSTDAPTGFINSLLFTNAASGTTPTYAQIYQNIEGLNCADLGFGTAAASTVTVSFWVKSSLTGTFSVALRNVDGNRSYVTTYTISAANTWEQKTVTVAGDTSGTWVRDNRVGINLVFRIGASSGTSTLNSWTATGDAFASGSVNVMGTANATWQVTGVQLEKGSTATSFDYRPYTTELLLCQRYFVKFGGEASAEVVAPSGIGSSTTSGQFYNLYPVRMRAIPTVAFNSLTLADTVNPAVTVTSIAFGTNVGSSQISSVSMNVASGVAANRPLYARTSGTDGFLSYSAEL